ncbi:HAMP domain-containing sensor histidine kinase [Corallococcus carmarthensis]|uniref:histidine kinase n=1 Tax=Corallococcus carmarthensis TaxID=2316728 RepID=A0A3A8K7E4_9BACT|nr:HAMP domain-containing sensor histidine kinase [Corallococcus carmarthensis]NOK17369.1 HAMP domain-containing histidine kinase [Corallococcus carmarthensis]RKH03217.1 sensor histidine kinase [Corallococcus carmarthensis]
MSLRAFFSTVVGGLVLLTVIAATLLVVLTTALERMASTLSESVEGVRQAEELEVDLLVHSRLVALPGAPILADPSRGRTPPQIESDLRRQLVEMHGTASTQEERQMVAEVQTEVYAYLHAQQAPLRQGLSAAQHDAAAVSSLDLALRSLERLIQINVDQAQAARQSAAYWSEMANVLGLVLGLLLMASLGLVVFWLRRFALRPVGELRRAMAGFGRGGRHLRAPEEGPLELRDMAHTFNEMADSLTHQQEQQLAFLAGVAHDLRNPLSALKLSTSLTGRGEVTPERMQRTLSLVRRQVARLDRMVGDLLDATRIEAGKLELQPEVRDTRELARSVVELYQSSDSGHTLELVVPDTAVLVRADPSRLEQVLNNLVSNALKYSPAGSRVEVSVGGDAEHVVVAVADQGIGMSPEELKGLFVPFQRAGNAKQRAPGVGLGLSVSRRIIEAHGGRIEVESRPGQGSVFRVHLARVSASGPPEPPAPSDDEEPAGVGSGAMH